MTTASVWQSGAARSAHDAATRPHDYLAAERNNAVHTALALILRGRRAGRRSAAAR